MFRYYHLWGKPKFRECNNNSSRNDDYYSGNKDLSNSFIYLVIWYEINNNNSASTLIYKQIALISLVTIHLSGKRLFNKPREFDNKPVTRQFIRKPISLVNWNDDY